MTHVTEQTFEVVERREIDGERAFPIYSIHVEYTQIMSPDEMRRRLFPERQTYKSQWRTAMELKWNVREHRQYDLTSAYIMPQDKLTPELESGHTYDLVQAVLKKRPDAHIIRATVKLIYWETWCLNWFSHHTHPLGRTDEELKQSWIRYVNRHDSYQRDLMGGRVRQDNGEYAVCLMGAEDRWRWRGENDDAENYICRCKGCTSWGIVRVTH